MAQVPRRGSRPTRFTWTCRRWPRRRSRFRRRRSPLQQRPAWQHRRRWSRQQPQRRRPHQRLRLLLPRHPHPQRRRHHPRPTIPGRHDNFGWRLKPKNQPSKNGFGEPRAQSGSARDRKLGHAQKSAADLPAGKHLCVTLAHFRSHHHFCQSAAPTLLHFQIIELRQFTHGSFRRPPAFLRTAVTLANVLA
jgi:hypothetical protein